MSKKDKQLKYTTASGYPGDGDWIDNAKFTNKFNDADIVIFEGGTDISPTIYGENRGIYTQVSGLTDRDKREIALYKRSLEAGKMMIGICRGGQLLTALNGGKLIQHVSNHTGRDHQVKTWDGRTYMMNTIHHQMFYPWELPKDQWKLISWTEGISNTYLNGDNEEINFPDEAFTDEALIVEPEVVFYPNTRSLAIQGHPEMLGYKSWHWNFENNQEDVHTLDYLNNLTKILFYEPNYFNRIAKEQA